MEKKLCLQTVTINSLLVLFNEIYMNINHYIKTVLIHHHHSENIMQSYRAFSKRFYLYKATSLTRYDRESKHKKYTYLRQINNTLNIRS